MSVQSSQSSTSVIFSLLLFELMKEQNVTVLVKKCVAYRHMRPVIFQRFHCFNTKTRM